MTDFIVLARIQVAKLSELPIKQKNKPRHREAVSGRGDLPAMLQTTGRLPAGKDCTD